MNHRVLDAIKPFFLWSFLISISSSLKIHLIIGSSYAFFSGKNILIPMAGAFGGFWPTAALSTATLALKALIKGYISPYYIVYHIPGLFASAYWICNRRLIGGIVPFLCVIAFLLHPEGGAAYPYTLFWLIPIITSITKNKNIFLNSLSSTLVAHAVGSVIWAYTVPMTSAMWIGLIPIVIIERFFFASSIAMTHKLITMYLSQRLYKIAFSNIFLIFAHKKPSLGTSND